MPAPAFDVVVVGGGMAGVTVAAALAPICRPVPPGDARPAELDVALALDRAPQATTLGLRSVVRAWAGLRTFAPDGLPVVGADDVVEGLVWLAGQGGYGIQMAPALALVDATAVTGAPLPASLDGLDVDALRPGQARRP